MWKSRNSRFSHSFFFARDFLIRDFLIRDFLILPILLGSQFVRWIILTLQQFITKWLIIHKEILFISKWLIHFHGHKPRTSSWTYQLCLMKWTLYMSNREEFFNSSPHSSFSVHTLQYIFLWAALFMAEKGILVWCPIITW